MWLSVSFSDKGGHNTSSSAVVAELTEVDSLPRAQVQSSVGNGNRNTGSHQGRFGMGGHVVPSFQRMVVPGFPFAHQVIENLFHVAPYVRVTVLVDGQSGTGMLDEEVEQSGFGQCRQVVQHLVRHQMKAAGAWPEGKSRLLYHHYNRLIGLFYIHFQSPIVPVSEEKLAPIL